MTKQEKQERINNLKEFLLTKLPEVQGKLEIHANRYRTKTEGQQFDLFVVTKSYNHQHLTYDMNAILGIKVNSQERLTSRTIGSDAAHDAVRALERALDLPQYFFRYVEHTC